VSVREVRRMRERNIPGGQADLECLTRPRGLAADRPPADVVAAVRSLPEDFRAEHVRGVG
jgi:hypothetical protein